jgi:hypothetical protein
LLLVFPILISCKKTDDMRMPGITLATSFNINYPAAYVVNRQSNSISVININTNSLQDSFKPGAMSSGNMSGMTSMNSGIMWPNNIFLNPSKKQLSLGIPGMDLSGGHDRGIAGMGGMYAIIDPVNGNISKVVALPVMNHNAAFSPDVCDLMIHNEPKNTCRHKTKWNCT